MQPDNEAIRMSKIVSINDRPIGEGCPTYIIAEIGINHNGDISIAKKLIDTAVLAGCDAVKFQKRTPELCVPPQQKNLMRETPWGCMSYLDYKRQIEFGQKDYEEIDQYCKEKGITWFASCWDEPSVDFIEQFDPAAYKIASASLTDDALLKHTNMMGHPVILSTGMSTMEEIHHAVSLFDKDRLLISHCNEYLSLQTRRAESAHDSHVEKGIQLSHRLFWSRSRVADNDCISCPRCLFH